MVSRNKHRKNKRRIDPKTGKMYYTQKNGVLKGVRRYCCAITGSYSPQCPCENCAPKTAPRRASVRVRLTTSRIKKYIRNGVNSKSKNKTSSCEILGASIPIVIKRLQSKFKLMTGFNLPKEWVNPGSGFEVDHIIALALVGGTGHYKNLQILFKNPKIASRYGVEPTAENTHSLKTTLDRKKIATEKRSVNVKHRSVVRVVIEPRRNPLRARGRVAGSLCRFAVA